MITAARAAAWPAVGSRRVGRSLAALAGIAHASASRAPRQGARVVGVCSARSGSRWSHQLGSAESRADRARAASARSLATAALRRGRELVRRRRQGDVEAPAGRADRPHVERAEGAQRRDRTRRSRGRRGRCRARRRRGTAASTPATVLPRALWRSTEPSAVRQSAAPASRPRSPTSSITASAAGAGVRAERVERRAEAAGGAARRGAARCRRRRPRRAARARGRTARCPARRRPFCGPNSAAAPSGPQSGTSTSCRTLSSHAREERARGREVQVELAEQRLARRARHACAEAREQPEAAVDGGRAAERDEHVRARRASSAARSRSARPAEPVRRGSRSRGASSARPTASRGLDQERAVAAVADRGAQRAAERVVRVDLDALGRARRRRRPRACPRRRRRAAQASGSPPARRTPSASAAAAAKASSAPRSLSGAQTTRGAAHRPSTARSRSSSEPSTRSASSSWMPSDGTAIDEHARGARGRGTRRRVLERDRLGGRDAERLAGRQVDVRAPASAGVPDRA